MLLLKLLLTAAAALAVLLLWRLARRRRMRREALGHGRTPPLGRLAACTVCGAYRAPGAGACDRADCPAAAVS